MTHLLCKTALLIVTALTIGTGNSYGGEWSNSLIQSEVTGWDSRGRVQEMEVRTGAGICMAAVTYNHGVPHIDVLIMSRTQLRNLGYRQINDGTEEGISNLVLMRNINEVILEHCLPLIGYIGV